MAFIFRAGIILWLTVAMICMASGLALTVASKTACPATNLKHTTLETFRACACCAAFFLFICGNSLVSLLRRVN